MKNTVKYKAQQFSDAVQADIKRSMFRRNSGKKTTMNASILTPVYLDEVLPGDTFNMNMSFISRMLTPLFPTMDTVNLDFYAFFVPNRIIWSGWEKLNGENKSSAWVQDTPAPLVPTTYLSNTPGEKVESGSLADYLDIPVGIELKLNNSISSLPFRAYYTIWNEWFRDQNTQAPLAVYRDNETGGVVPGKNVFKKGSLMRACKPHDYFTSCLPAPQKGSSQLIPIELNDLIPVIVGGSHTKNYDKNTSLLLRRTQGDSIVPAGTLVTKDDGTLGVESKTVSELVPGAYPSNLWADGRGIPISGSTISDLRTAFQLQKLYEKDARGGTRYIEMLKAHFGVDAQDYRLQRPEFLGKVSSSIGIHQVAQTSSTDSTSPQGNVSAFAYGSGTDKIIKKSFVEHGLIMILAVARQRKTYQQGIDKLWHRIDRFDFYYPALAHISEQPVYKREIYADATTMDTDTDLPIFGYQEAWAEYRYKPSKVSGLMRSNVPGSFDPYHYADWYDDLPSLSDTFMYDNSLENVERTLAVDSSNSNQILLDIAFDLTCVRPMPVNSIPGLVDHF